MGRLNGCCAAARRGRDWAWGARDVEHAALRLRSLRRGPTRSTGRSARCCSRGCVSLPRTAGSSCTAPRCGGTPPRAASLAEAPTPHAPRGRRRRRAVSSLRRGRGARAAGQPQGAALHLGRALTGGGRDERCVDGSAHAARDAGLDWRDGCARAARDAELGGRLQMRARAACPGSSPPARSHAWCGFPNTAEAGAADAQAAGAALGAGGGCAHLRGASRALAWARGHGRRHGPLSSGAGPPFSAKIRHGETNSTAVIHFLRVAVKRTPAPSFGGSGPQLRPPLCRFARHTRRWVLVSATGDARAPRRGSKTADGLQLVGDEAASASSLAGADAGQGVV